MLKLAYQQGETILHRLYPITKLSWLFLGTILIFVLTTGYLLWVITGVFLLILLLIHPTIWRVRGFRLVIITGLLLLLLYLLFDKTGKTLFEPAMPHFRITSGGLDSGLRFSGRFLSIVFLSYIFILTTEPNQLAYALMKLGIPYRYGFMLVTALRLAPILEDEGRTIYYAQLVRGIQYDRGNIKKLLLVVRQFLTPLLISALRRADKLVFSMEGRGFGKQASRTFRRRSSASHLDILVTLGMVLFFATLLILNFWRSL